MATQNVCSFFKYGYCKHGKFCRSYHESEICDKKECDVFLCTFRHPIICKFYKKYKRCKFDPCAYKHEDTENIIEMLQKECLATNVKIAKLIEDISMQKKRSRKLLLKT